MKTNRSSLAMLAGMLAMTAQGEVKIGFRKDNEPPPPPPQPPRGGPWSPLDLGPTKTSLGTEVIPKPDMPRPPEGQRQKIRQWGRARGLSYAAIMRNPELLARALEDVRS